MYLIMCFCVYIVIYIRHLYVNVVKNTWNEEGLFLEIQA